MAKRKEDKLRVAFIGAGGIAGTHMGYYKDMEDVEMVAASDVVAASVQRRCEARLAMMWLNITSMLAGGSNPNTIAVSRILNLSATSKGRKAPYIGVRTG